MQNIFHFKLKYFLLALFIFGIEVIIALYFHDNFIRPVVGDFLIVILMYFSLKSILNVADKKLAIGVLIFAFIIEGLQYINLLEKLDLRDSYAAQIILGTTFEWRDLLAYTLGVGCALLADRFLLKTA